MKKNALFAFLIGSTILCGSTLHADTLATIGTKTITTADFEARIKTFPTQYADAFKNKDTRAKLLDQMIDEQLVMSAAKKSGIDQTKAYKDQIEAAKTQLLLGIHIRNTIDNQVAISDDDAKAYFQANPQQFQETELRRAVHILVKTEDEAKEIQKSLQSGADFAKLAKEKSLDTNSGANGGDLGWFKKGQMVPEFEQAAFSLTKGQTSSIVKTQFGFHIIKLTDIQVRPKVEFTNEVSTQIKEVLINEKKRSLMGAYLEKLRKEAKIKKEISKL